MQISKFLGVLSLSLIGVAASSHADFIITDGSSLFAPSFRGSANTTYFGWASGTWDGNADAAPGDPAIPDTLNGNPSINPGGLAAPLLTQGGSADIVSGSNNIYSSVSQINAQSLSLTIPTSGTVGAGFTTIIIQGKGLGGAAFGGSGGLDAFSFGAIAGVDPTYVYGTNSAGQGQWWAKWEIPGNAASYTVGITGYDNGVGVLSVTDMSVDSNWSATSFSADTAAVPEPSTYALFAFAGGIACLAIRRRAITFAR